VFQIFDIDLFRNYRALKAGIRSNFALFLTRVKLPKRVDEEMSESHRRSFVAAPGVLHFRCVATFGRGVAKGDAVGAPAPRAGCTCTQGGENFFRRNLQGKFASAPRQSKSQFLGHFCCGGI